MSLEKLLEKAQGFEIPQENIASVEKRRLEFISRFPMDKINDFSLDDYVSGTGKNSFSYWLEFKKIMFGIGGGSALKFGIYKGGDGKYYGGTGQNKILLEGKKLKEKFEQIKNGIVLALEYAKNDKIVEIQTLNIPIWNMVLQKILVIYYPDKFISIGASDVLMRCAKDIDIKNVDLNPKNLIQINYECNQKLHSIDIFTNWPYEKLGTLIWKHYNIKYWLYAPGQDAEFWDEFFTEGIMGLAWDNLGDLNDYKSKKEISQKLQELENTNESKKNDAAANFEFKNGMAIGDVVIAKKGRGELLGFGIVTSNYYYDRNRTRCQKCRKVDWKKNGLWKADHVLVSKTLTDITKYPTSHPDYSNYYERLLGTMEKDQISKRNYKEEYSQWLDKHYDYNSNTKSSYIRAIEILSEKVEYNLFEEDDFETIDLLYQDLLKEQKKENGRYFHEDAPSYGEKGWYSAAINTYSIFLKEYLLGNFISNSTDFKAPLNQILYGPPGTGKTFNTILLASQIIKKSKNIDYDTAKKIFNENLEDKIEFITFHQNYSYEEFIQGLRPDVETKGNLSFERKDGIFLKMSINALFEYYKVYSNRKRKLKLSDQELDLNEVYLSFFDFLKSNPNKTFKSKTGYDLIIKSFTDKKCINFSHSNSPVIHTVSGNRLIKLFEKFPSIDKIKNLTKDINEAIGGCNATVYYTALKEFIEYYNNQKGQRAKSGQEDLLNYDDLSLKEKKEFLHTINLSELSSINTNDVPNYVLIIDEINRANIARVFGELITLIEPDKRSHGSIPLKCTLPSGEEFIVPSNLYLIGTMNTADKSIALVDIALRRRFCFEAMYPDYTIEGINDLEILQKINAAIIKEKGYDFQIGHSYFMDSKDDPYDLVSRMNKKVIPLLLEYFMNKADIVEKIVKLAGLKIVEGSWPIEILEKE